MASHRTRRDRDGGALTTASVVDATTDASGNPVGRTVTTVNGRCNPSTARFPLMPAVRAYDLLLRRTSTRLRRLAHSQMSRYAVLSGGDRNRPAIPGSSGTQRARRPLRPELEAVLGVWPSSQLAQCAGGRAGWRLSGDVAVLFCCTPKPLMVFKIVRGSR